MSGGLEPFGTAALASHAVRQHEYISTGAGSVRPEVDGHQITRSPRHPPPPPAGHTVTMSKGLGTSTLCIPMRGFLSLPSRSDTTYPPLLAPASDWCIGAGGSRARGRALLKPHPRLGAPQLKPTAGFGHSTDSVRRRALICREEYTWHRHTYSAAVRLCTVTLTIQMKRCTLWQTTAFLRTQSDREWV